MTTPVSWLQIAPGWSVVGSDGEVVGTVLSIVGDKSRDIFNGLAIGVADPPQLGTSRPRTSPRSIPVRSRFV
jgi:hypothetical protein